jgi:hypothetical protein
MEVTAQKLIDNRYVTCNNFGHWSKIDGTRIEWRYVYEGAKKIGIGLKWFYTYDTEMATHISWKDGPNKSAKIVRL